MNNIFGHKADFIIVLSLRMFKMYYGELISDAEAMAEAANNHQYCELEKYVQRIRRSAVEPLARIYYPYCDSMDGHLEDILSCCDNFTQSGMLLPIQEDESYKIRYANDINERLEELKVILLKAEERHPWLKS